MAGFIQASNPLDWAYKPIGSSCNHFMSIFIATLLGKNACRDSFPTYQSSKGAAVAKSSVIAPLSQPQPSGSTLSQPKLNGLQARPTSAEWIQARQISANLSRVDLSAANLRSSGLQVQPASLEWIASSANLSRAECKPADFSRVD